MPFAPPSFLTYYLNLATLSKVEFNPTDMESTIFTLCYGTDLFLIRYAPDKAIDDVQRHICFVEAGQHSQVGEVYIFEEHLLSVE